MADIRDHVMVSATNAQTYVLSNIDVIRQYTRMQRREMSGQVMQSQHSYFEEYGPRQVDSSRRPHPENPNFDTSYRRMNPTQGESNIGRLANVLADALNLDGNVRATYNPGTQTVSIYDNQGDTDGDNRTLATEEQLAPGQNGLEPTLFRAEQQEEETVVPTNNEIDWPF